MATKVFGYSDDNLAATGDIRDEFGCWDRDLTVWFSDGTVLKSHYGKPCRDNPGNEDGVWALHLYQEGSLLESIDYCFDSEADPYSDVAHFRDGLKWWHPLDDALYWSVRQHHESLCQDPEVCVSGIDTGCNEAIRLEYNRHCQQTDGQIPSEHTTK